MDAAVPSVEHEGAAVDTVDAHTGTASSRPGSPTDSVSTRRKLDQRRWPSVYDAVAGRLKSTHLFDPDVLRERNSFDDSVLAPDEVLFQSAYAPPRYQEHDLYFANDHLPHAGEGVLPDSDLLKAVHSYASLFYEALASREKRPEWDMDDGEDEGEEDEDENEENYDEISNGEDASDKDAEDSVVDEDNDEDEDDDDDDGWEDEDDEEERYTKPKFVDERSMDETALLAFGVLLEEAGRQVLGARGDLVFTEAREDADRPARRRRLAKKTRKGGGGDEGQQGMTDTDREASPRKKTKLSG